jgi:hypothetical protein
MADDNNALIASEKRKTSWYLLLCEYKQRLTSHYVYTM